ncbi:MAG: NADH-quinone oxidoreductase subunit J family protein [Caldilineaceae bacterium]
MQEMLELVSGFIPPITHQIFLILGLLVGVCALLVATSRNLFHSALGLVGALFGIAAVFALAEAEFVAVAQVLIYVGAISTLITFAIMLTRGMMYGRTSPNNRQMLASLLAAGLLFAVLMGLVFNVSWPQAENVTPINNDAGEAMIAQLGLLFVGDYLIAFELLALLLLVALSGALLLARDRK